MLDDRGHMTPTEVERDAAPSTSRCGGGPATTRSSAPSSTSSRRPRAAPTWRASSGPWSRTLNEQLRAARLLKDGDEPVTKDDMLEGLTAVVTVRLAEPQFEGQTKEVLGTPAALPDRRPGGRHAAEGLLRRRRRGATSSRPARSWRRSIAAAKARIAAREQREQPAAQDRPGELVAARQARRLPLGRRAQRAVHRRGRLGARHRQAGPRLGVPGAAADPRQDPQRPEGLDGGHAQERRVRRDHPGHRRRLGPHLRPRLGPLRQVHLHGRRRRRRRAHPHPAADARSSATCGRCWRPAGSSPRSRRCTGSS